MSIQLNTNNSNVFSNFVKPVQNQTVNVVTISSETQDSFESSQKKNEIPWYENYSMAIIAGIAAFAIGGGLLIARRGKGKNVVNNITANIPENTIKNIENWQNTRKLVRFIDDQLLRHCTTAGEKGKELPHPLPPLDEQKRILELIIVGLTKKDRNIVSIGKRKNGMYFLSLNDPLSPYKPYNDAKTGFLTGAPIVQSMETNPRFLKLLEQKLAQVNNKIAKKTKP